MRNCGCSLHYKGSETDLKILVSACLLGVCCRYDGASKPCPQILKLAERHTLIPVCPEQLGGISTPRPPAERRGNCVLTEQGIDVTQQYQRGAEETLRLYNLLGCEAAILKERSPSCGSGEIYDGSFTRTTICGDGVTAERLKQAGIPVYGESQIEQL